MKSAIIIIVLFLFSCQTQKNKDKELIESFIKEIVLTKKTFNFSDTKKYVSYSKKNLWLNKKNNRREVEKFVSIHIRNLNDKLYEFYLKYKIISHKESKKYNEVNLTYYDRYSKVYHLVVDEKIIRTFVIAEDKIISFIYSMVNKGQRKKPHLF